MPLPATIPLPGGLAMPSVGLGTFRSRGEEASRAVGWALQHGFRHIDTASIYRNEAEVAAAIESSVPRSEVFVTTKISPYQQGTAKAEAACQAALQALGSPIDLVLIHWPGAAKQEAQSPANAALRHETWRVLERYHLQGSFRAIGVSNYHVRHLQELLQYAQVKPAVNQVECHPRYQQRELRHFCAQHGIAVVAYASLGCGELLSDPTVQAVAADSGVTPAQALLLWGLQRGMAVIPKSVREERIAEVAPAVLLDRQLSQEALQRLDALEEQLGGPHKYCWDPAGIA